MYNDPLESKNRVTSHPVPAAISLISSFETRSQSNHGVALQRCLMRIRSCPFIPAE